MPKKKTTSDSSQLKKRRVKRPDGGEDVFTPLEWEFRDFVGLLAIEIDGRKIGAFLCRKGESSYKIQFPFKCRGIAAFLTELEANAVWDKVDGGLKELGTCR